MPTPAFTLTDVRFRDILTIPRLEIRARAVTCIVGASGSGKTTLLKLLNRMVTPDTGTILYGETPVTQIDPVQLRRRVVMAGQTPVMFDGSIRDNLLIGRAFAGENPLPDDDLRRLLTLMDLDKPLAADAAPLSGGEKQRVALARVLAMRPDVALLDEPSSALDAGTERTIIDRVIAAAREQGTTLVVVTHNRAMADRIADDIVEIRGGRVVSPAEATL